MTLGFSTQINGKPNCFIQKIWIGLISNLGDQFDNVLYQEKHRTKFGFYWRPEIELPPKLHTMREDPHDRWKPGMDIHMVINNRTKNRFQFAPVVKCVSVQEIEIKDVTHLTINGPFTKISKTITRGGWTETFTQAFYVKVDGIQLSHDKVYQLAINDGFDSVEDFFAYFNKDFTGKIIHWADLKY